MNLKELAKDIATEVEAILSNNFGIEVTNTVSVPHSDDQAITFPNLDQMRQGCKIIETCVLYIDIRRSTELNLQHRPKTVSRLYSSFVRAMVRCAEQYGGHVRGIIGDRVMVVFDASNCFTNAVHTAQAMNTVSNHIINKRFKNGEVSCGIGIDYGRMLVTKTGFRRHGVQRHNYRSLVWLGRPANVASKLTDIANKPASRRNDHAVQLGYHYPYTDQWGSETVSAETFINSLTVVYLQDGTRLFRHENPYVYSATNTTRAIEITSKTPPIVMTKAVYDGFRAKNPEAKSIKENWYHRVSVTVPGYSDAVFGGAVEFADLKPE
jgi:adenylate cyclase